MAMEVLIYSGGVYHLIWALFDSLWPFLWNWKKTLSSLDDVQRTIPYILSRLIVLLYLAIAYVSLFRTSELIGTDLGRSILLFVSVYWIFRAIMQIQFFGLLGKFNSLSMDRESYNLPGLFKRVSQQTLGNLVFVIFLFGIACYLTPFLNG